MINILINLIYQFARFLYLRVFLLCLRRFFLVFGFTFKSSKSWFLRKCLYDVNFGTLIFLNGDNNKTVIACTNCLSTLLFLYLYKSLINNTFVFKTFFRIVPDKKDFFCLNFFVFNELPPKSINFMSGLFSKYFVLLNPFQLY